MSNLLWKFVALAGVAGVGFMVLLQTMESMSLQPRFAPQQAAAAPQDQTASQDAGEAPNDSLPPFRTKETATLGELPPRPAETNLAPPAGDPFADQNSPIASNEAPPSPSVPDSGGQGFPASEFPEFPPFPQKQASVETEPTAELPDLPVMIPMVAEAENDGFSEENPFSDPPNLAPPSQVKTASAEEDPFSDPVPPPKSEETESELPNIVPFDPYEPLPESSESETPEPSPAEADSADSPVLFPPAEGSPTLPETDDPNAELESPAPEFPTPDFASPSFPADAPTSDAAERENNPAGDNLPAFPEEAPKAKTSPGRASVQIPLAPPAEDEPKFAPDLFDFEAKGSEPAGPETAADSDPNIKSLPDTNVPEHDVEEAPLQEAGPETAVPLAEEAEAPPKTGPEIEEPFIDPLDQLTFPEADPSLEDSPRQNPPESIPPAPGASPLPTGSENDPSVMDSPADAEKNPAASHLSESEREFAGVLASGPQQPELKIEKTAPPKAALGQPMIYNILVRNVGQSAAHQVIVEDQVPKGTQLTGTIPRGEMAENRLIWRLGIIQPGEEKKIAVRVIPIQEGQIGSVAKVSFVAEVAAKTVVAAPKLELEFTGPAKAVLGDPVTYHFKLSNVGTGDASKVFLRNILPEGLNHPDGNDLEYEVGTLKAGEVKEIDLTVNATKAGDFTNKAVVSASGGLETEAATKVKIIGDRLVITRTGPKRRYVGRTASYSNTIVNQSDTKIAPVHVVEVIPAGMEFVEASAGGRFDPQKRTVTWAIQELGPNQNLLLKLNLLAKQEGPQASEVVAYDPNGTRVQVKSETAVEGYTALRLDVREYAEPVDVGEQVGLRVVATNKGTKASTNVVVKITIPAEMEFVSAQGPVDFKRSGATLTFSPVESLAAQEEMEFDLVLKSVQPGDSRVRMEITSDETQKPLTREEAVHILASRP